MTAKEYAHKVAKENTNRFDPNQPVAKWSAWEDGCRTEGGVQIEERYALNKYGYVCGCEWRVK